MKLIYSTSSLNMGNTFLERDIGLSESTCNKMGSVESIKADVNLKSEF